MLRNHTIDSFRGLAILGMIFFTVTLRLSTDLPESLRHNVWGSVHLGDFVLSVFLFASGLSLAYFLKKKEKMKKHFFLQDVVKRFSKLALVGVLLSFFSAYGFLEMDEVMLSALLFIACVGLSRLDWKIVLSIIFFIDVSYIFVMQVGLGDIFIGHYLGGYPAAFYYLPVMLAGLTIGKGIISDKLWCEKNKIFIIIIFIFFIIFRIFTPVEKLPPSPSFILLSIVFSFFIFAVVDLVSYHINTLNKIGYIGKKPLRYWIMMYSVFIIPLWFYGNFSGQDIPLHIYWPISVLISLGMMFIFPVLNYIIYYVSNIKISN